MVDIHIPTPDTKLAASLGTMGFILRLRKVLDEKSGTQELTWQIAPNAPTRPNLKLHELIRNLRDRTLEKKDPQHPLLDGLGSCRNRERILGHIHDGREIALGEDESGKRSCYVHSPAVAPPASFGRYVTRDFRVVCALGRFGFPIVKWTGNPGSYEFTVTARSVLPLLPGDAWHLVRGYELLQDAERDAAPCDAALDPDHPFCYAMRTLENHTYLLGIIKSARQKILMRKPRSRKAVFIDEDASDAAYDLAARHFKV